MDARISFLHSFYYYAIVTRWDVVVVVLFSIYHDKLYTIISQSTGYNLSS